VAGESTYVEQVVRNFLSNAAKYSPPGSTIEIELEGGEGASMVRVLDRGIGVDEAATVEAFELFYRTPDAARVASGAGIGLFVCRHLIEAMGGRVWIQPRDGGGTEAGFALPAIEVDDPED
jgi:signal transduction histidine kinase